MLSSLLQFWYSQICVLYLKLRWWDLSPHIPYKSLSINIWRGLIEVTNFKVRWHIRILGITHYCSRVYMCLKARWQVPNTKSEAAVIVKKSYVIRNILCGHFVKVNLKKWLKSCFEDRPECSSFNILITMKQTPSILNWKIHQKVTAKKKYRKVRNKCWERFCKL